MIEILLVITIIGILAGLLLPAISKAILKAKVVKAKTEAKSIAVALKAYFTEYNKWPNAVPAGADYTWPSGDNSGIISILRGTNPSENPRLIVFLEPSRFGTGAQANSFVDPWNQPYIIAVDGDFDNRVSFSPSNAYTPAVGQNAAAYSLGPPAPNTVTDCICSWQ